MVRHRKRKTNIGLTEEHVMFEAVKSVLNGGLSIKASAARYSIARTTLTRYVKKCKDLQIDWDSASVEDVPRLSPRYDNRKIFSDQQEVILCDYLQTCAKLHHGMPPKAARALAYDLATANNIPVPDSWSKNRMAGEDWLTAFLTRNKNISIRTAESTSISRAIGFNKPVVSSFFDKYEQLLQRFHFRPESIYNTDETGLTTVQDSIKVLATKGQKQVGQLTSAERGTLITMCGTINALGNSIPPVLIFPRVHFKDFMIKGAPHGTVGAATPSGWISKDVFLKYLQHFVLHASPTKEKPVLIIMDNHDSHISLVAVDYAKKNNVILLTFPPHTTHRLQPLDRCVYGPLKKYYNDGCRAWLLHHPGKRITIYDIPEILGQAYPLAFSSNNIISAFRKTGLYPFNRHIFDDSEFLAASVTDMTPSEATERALGSKSTSLDTPSTSCSETPANSHYMNERETTPPSQFIPPHVIQPYPKAQKNDSGLKGRKKRKSQILTDTPIRDEIAENENLKITKKAKITVKKNISITDKKTDPSSSSDSETISELSKTNSDDSNDSESEEANPCEDLKVDAFVLVKFATKKTITYYVGQIKEILQDECIINFLRKKNEKFLFPAVEDVASVSRDDLELVLPQPVKTGGTARTSSSFRFMINLDAYNVC